jgi:hypothetical protein
VNDEAVALLGRLEVVAGRLRRHAESAAPGGLTAPDPPTGERWDWGQVWAHLAEFLPYWMGQVRMALAASPEEQVPFGRTKADPERIAAIERDRRVPVPQLLDRLERQMEDLRAMIESLTSVDWGRQVTHETLGIMDMPLVFDEFLVGHLEQHAAQLDELTGEAPA